MSKNVQRYIFISGAHRSGTTWVGKMLALAEGMNYLHEPFNLLVNPSVFSKWFTYISEANGNEYLQFLADLFSSKSTQNRLLIKDPIAVFSLEWLASHFPAHVIVMIRHPCGFTASLKRLNWTHDFRHFLDQPLLINDINSDLVDEISEEVKHPSNIIGQAILLWKLIYTRVKRYQESNPDWIFIRHEDICLNPLSLYEKLYASIGVPFSADIKEKIQSYSDSANPVISKGYDNIKRHSSEMIDSWRNILSKKEIERVEGSLVELMRHYSYKVNDTHAVTGS